MSDHQEESDVQAAIQFAVIQICAQEETHTKTKITPQAIHALSELTYLYATTSLKNDLDAFSTHAGRKTIHEADVKLVARKNPDNLLDKLNRYAEEHFIAPKVAPTKARKKEIIFNLDKDASSSSSEGDILGNPSKKIPGEPLPPPTDSSLSSADDGGGGGFKLPARPGRKQAISIRSDDSSDSSIEGNRPNTRVSSIQPSYSAGGTRIRNILDQLSQDSFENREDRDMQE